MLEPIYTPDGERGTMVGGGGGGGRGLKIIIIVILIINNNRYLNRVNPLVAGLVSTGSRIA